MNYIDSAYYVQVCIYSQYLQDGKMCIHMFLFSQGQGNLLKSACFV